MKRSVFHVFSMSVLLLAPAVAWAAWETPFMYESEVELFGSADLRDTGLADAVIVDREDGTYLIGEAQVGGGVQWRQPRPSGIENADTAALGRFGGNGEYGLAVGGAKANRIQVFVGDEPAVGAFPLGAGPGPFVPVPLKGPAAGRDDLMASTILNGDEEGSLRSLLLNEVTGFPVAEGFGLAAVPGFARAATLEAGAQPVVFTRMDPPAGTQEETLFVFERAEGTSVRDLGKIEARPGMRALPGNFRGENRGDIVLYWPGSDRIALYRTSWDNDALVLDLHDQIDAEARIDLLQRLPGDPARLLALLNGGETARIYEYTPGAGMQPVDTLTPQADGEFLTGAAPLGEEDFLLFSGPDRGGRSSVYHDVRADGEGGYEVAGSGKLPARAAGFLGATVFLYSGDPFVDVESLLLELRHADAWTVRGTLDGDPARAQAYASVFGGSSEGLTGLSFRDLGPAPEEVTHVLTNQPNVETPFSVYSFDPVAAPAIAMPTILPAPGTYRNAIQVAFEARAGNGIVYRTGESESWQPYDEPFWLFRDTEVQFFAIGGGGETSGIRTAAYEFSVEPHEMDSSGNGVPDFVEAFHGLDPHTTGVRDGVSDLEEILGLAGEEGALDLQASFDVLATVTAFSDESGSVLAGDRTGLHGFDARGSRLASGRSDKEGDNSEFFPAVHLENFPVDTPQRLFVVGSQSFFPLMDYVDDEARGREVVAVQPVPELRAPEVEYVFGQAGGVLADEVDAWIAAALEAYNEAHRTSVSLDIGPVDTLHAALVERTFTSLLVDLGHWPAGELDHSTLFSFRPGDADRHRITRADLAALSSLDPQGQSAYHPAEIIEGLRDALEADDAGAASLRQFANDVHRIGAEEGPGSPGHYPAPLTVFRALLSGEPLPGNYEADGGWSELELGDLAATAAGVIASPEARELVTWDLLVREESFQGSCLTLYSIPGDIPIRLVRRDGRPYRFPGGFPPAPGSEVKVVGIENPARSDCPGMALQVVSLTFMAAPAVAVDDQDGNLLPDSWELLFFGETGQDPFSSQDGTEYSMLQQYLEGTDPSDPADLPDFNEAPPEDLGPPAISIDEAEGGGDGFRLTWQWSARYADDIEFGAIASSDLSDYQDLEVTATHDGAGNFELVIPPLENGDLDREFYRVFLRVR